MSQKSLNASRAPCLIVCFGLGTRSSIAVSLQRTSSSKGVSSPFVRRPLDSSFRRNDEILTGMTDEWGMRLVVQERRRILVLVAGLGVV